VVGTKVEEDWFWGVVEGVSKLQVVVVAFG